MTLVAKSDQSTGNHHYASYALRSGELLFTVTAPYSRSAPKESSAPPCPWYLQGQAMELINKHGLFVRAIGGWAGRRWPAGRPQLKGSCGTAWPELLVPSQQLRHLKGAFESWQVPL